MTDHPADSSTPPTPQPLWVIGNDPIFRLGLVTALGELQRFEVVQNCDRATALSQLATLDTSLLTWLIVELDTPDFAWLEQLQTLVPTTQTLLLISLSAVEQETIASLGYDYCCPKGSSLDAIAAQLLQLSAGQAPNAPPTPRATPLLSSATFPQAPPRWLYNLRRSGLTQIEGNLVQINQSLTQNTASRVDRWFWQGRQRELQLAKWLVNQLLPVQVILTPAVSASPQVPPEVPPPSIETQSLAQQVLARFRDRVQLGLENTTPNLMAIDILHPPKRKELVYVIQTQLERWLQEATFLDAAPTTFHAQQTDILHQLWRSSIQEWSRRYYASNVLPDPDAPAIPTALPTPLLRLPFVADLLAYLVHESPLTIDQTPYRPESPEAQERAALLLDHLMVQLANQVMDVLLNQYADDETVKLKLYQQNFFATREITRFRNELSWSDRRTTLFLEPIAIFESRYQLWSVVNGKIVSRPIYAPRLEELRALEGIPWLVTMGMETRDALAPRVRSAVAFVGQGVIYVLTQVIGRGLGLIGRGIVQGLGSSLQETRYGRRGNE